MDSHKYVEKRHKPITLSNSLIAAFLVKNELDRVYFSKGKEISVFSQIGKVMIPRDNSYNHNIQTGKWGDIIGDTFVILSEPYEKLSDYSVGVSQTKHRFVRAYNVNEGFEYELMYHESWVTDEVNKEVESALVGAAVINGIFNLEFAYVGRKIKVLDNSYITSLDSNAIRPSLYEKTFVIISEPYIKGVTTFGETEIYPFVKVISPLTGFTYEVLFDENWIVG